MRALSKRRPDRRRPAPTGSWIEPVPPPGSRPREGGTGSSSEPVGRGAGRRRGLSAVEMLVVLVLVGLTMLFLLMAVPRGREQARLAACQKNLSQIGLALSLYDQLQRSLPTVGRLAPVDEKRADLPPGPLRALLETLGLQDFMDLSPNAPAPRATGPVPGEVPVPGFVCASDPGATAGRFPAPISYRAATGSDEHGDDGAFAPGRKLSLAQVEQGDGSSFTAGFSERLVGDGVDDHFADVNYAVVPGPLPRDGCSLIFLKNRRGAWRGDAGSSWRPAGYVSTLYNHGLRPNGGLSCVAADGGSAFQGASSGHVRGVNLLMLDGAVKLVLPSISPKVWEEFAGVRPPTGDAPGRTPAP
ncbi:MAG: DUF1559 domain-containing protein [Isosphaeraceae bacterium]